MSSSFYASQGGYITTEGEFNPEAKEEFEKAIEDLNRVQFENHGPGARPIADPRARPVRRT